MSVAHVYAGYVSSRTEGITRNVQGLVDALAAEGEEVSLRASQVDLADLNRLRTHVGNVRAARALVRAAVEDPRVDVIHHHVNIAAVGIALRRARGSKRALLHVWNALYRRRDLARAATKRVWAHRLFNGPRAARWGTESAGELVVSSRFQARQLWDAGVRRPIHVIPNGIDTEAFRPATASQQAEARRVLGVAGDPLVLYYGHLSAWKGVDTLVGAFGAFRRQAPGARLVIAHTSYGDRAPRLARAITREGLRDHVTLLGFAHVPTLLAAADVVAVPPIAAVGTACHPNTILEALASGSAVVSTRVGSIPEAVRDGETGLLVPPSDEAALAGAFTAFTEAGLRRRLGAAARRDAVARFDWPLVARRMQTVYSGRARPEIHASDAAERRSAVQREREAWA